MTIFWHNFEKSIALIVCFVRYLALVSPILIPKLAGEFGSMMELSLVNDGPVTFMLDSKKADDGDELTTAKPAAAVTLGKQEKVEIEKTQQ